ncbi:MAG: ABC transporter permease [Bacteroidia bacterium]|nr:ABC transporter permease [Bacteroidia bacterium]
MLLNYFKVVFRNYRKNKLYASLNLLGLSIGYTSCLLIGAFLIHETSFESFHSQSKRIYRASHHYYANGGFESHWARTYLDIINELPTDMPEVKHLIRFQNHQRRYIRINQNKFRAPNTFVTDAEVFEVFDFKLIYGKPSEALKAPSSVVLTESIARKYFGEENPIGKELYVVGDYTTEEELYTVTGVMQDLPNNTHMPIDILLSFQSPEDRRWWAYVYILLEEGTDIHQVEGKMEDFFSRHNQDDTNGRTEIVFQALEDIHLNSNLARELKPNGDKLYVRVFLFVGIFILLIALINYLNLSSALAMSRGKEVGLRLVLGASRKNLILFAIAESVIYNLLAAIITIGLSAIVMPFFLDLVEIPVLINPWFLGASLLGLAFMGGLLAGIYPAFVLAYSNSGSMFRASQNIKFGQTKAAYRFKRFLVGIQFASTTLLLISTWIANNQVSFLHNKQLGMQTEQVLAIPAVPNPVTDKYPLFREQAKKIKGVKSVSACMEVPSREIRDVGPTLVVGGNQDPQKAPMLDMQVISPDFFETMGIKLLAGEDRSGNFIFTGPPEFSEEFSPAQYFASQERNYLINEEAMNQLGWQDPQEAIGQQISWSIGGFNLKEGPITGIVENVHQESLKNKVDPTIMVVEPIWLRTFLLKLETKDVSKTLAGIQSNWNELFPTYPFEYQFVDELYNKLYKQERVQLRLLIYLSLIAIIIAFLGLFSLVAYSLQSRMKEIAIRKITGAGFVDLLLLIGKEYVLILGLGSMLAIPFSYWGLKNWLENFAYHTDISVWAFLFSILGLISLVLATVGMQIFLNNTRNPAEILRE